MCRRENINCWFVINFPCKLHWCDSPQPICKIIKWLIITGRGLLLIVAIHRMTRQTFTTGIISTKYGQWTNWIGISFLLLIILTIKFWLLYKTKRTLASPLKFKCHDTLTLFSSIFQCALVCRQGLMSMLMWAQGGAGAGREYYNWIIVCITAYHCPIKGYCIHRTDQSLDLSIFTLHPELLLIWRNMLRNFYT